MGAQGAMIAQQAANVVGAGLNIGFAKTAAKDEINANTDFNSRSQTELTRQQREVNLQSAEARGDRIEQAERELALLRVVNAERGAGGSMGDRQILDLERIKGKDLGRIERGRVNEIDAIQSEKVSVATNTRNASRAASNKALAKVTESLLKATGSGVQIHSDYEAKERMVESSRNKRK